MESRTSNAATWVTGILGLAVTAMGAWLAYQQLELSRLQMQVADQKERQAQAEKISRKIRVVREGDRVIVFEQTVDGRGWEETIKHEYQAKEWKEILEWFPEPAPLIPALSTVATK